MIQVDDAFGLIDRLYSSLPGVLDWLPANVRGYLAVPLVTAVVLLVPRVAVRRVLAAAGVVTDFVLALVFRLLSLPLTGLHYAIGDWTVAGTRGARVTTRYRVFRAGQWLSRFNPMLLLLAGIAVTVMWNTGYCARNPGVGCADPLGQWWHDFWVLCRSVWSDLSRPAL
jgi:hypothetical protein